VIQDVLDAAVHLQPVGLTPVTVIVPSPPLPRTVVFPGDSVTLVQAGCWAKAVETKRGNKPVAARRQKPTKHLLEVSKPYINTARGRKFAPEGRGTPFGVSNRTS
jgi:hypothetical protein